MLIKIEKPLYFYKGFFKPEVVCQGILTIS